MLKYIFLIISAGGRGLWACLGAWSDFPSFLSLADHMPVKGKEREAGVDLKQRRGNQDKE